MKTAEELILDWVDGPGPLRKADLVRAAQAAALEAAAELIEERQSWGNHDTDEHPAHYPDEDADAIRALIPSAPGTPPPERR